LWYNQTEAKWVMVVSGCGHVAIEDENTHRVLGPGDVLLLPAGCRHRVKMASVDAPTI
jgi:cupin 2 domain-containing protein